MRHRKKSDKLSRSRAQRKALLKSLVRSFLISERIKTTPRRARATSAKTERLITLGKKGDLAARRLAYSFLQDHRLVTRLFDEIAPRFKGVTGGYTRMMNIGFRKGDGAKISILELTQVHKAKKPLKEEGSEVQPEAVHEEETASQEAPKKASTSKTGIRQSLRKIFKKERDAL
jgi:large subunit ribosomal protein L17